jgi:predicted membrane protein
MQTQILVSKFQQTENFKNQNRTKDDENF